MKTYECFCASYAVRKGTNTELHDFQMLQINGSLVVECDALQIGSSCQNTLLLPTQSDALAVLIGNDQCKSS